MKSPNNRSVFYLPNVILFFAILVGLIIIGVSTVRMTVAQSGFEIAYQENNTKKANLQAEIDKLKIVTEEPDEIQKQIYSAVQIGSKVANYQTEFQTCYQAADIKTALSENVKSLMPLVDMADGNGYSVWFVPDTISDTSHVTWRFATNYEFTQETMPVLWLCTDTKGELVAYTTGVYVAETNTFTKIVCTLTNYGTTQYRKVEMNDTAGLEDDVDYIHDDPAIDIPAGYSLDASGNLVDANGQPYVATDSEGEDIVEWAGEFSNDFGDDFSQAVQDRKDAVAAAGNGGGN